MRNSALFVLAPLAIITTTVQAANFTVADININELISFHKKNKKIGFTSCKRKLFRL